MKSKAIYYLLLGGMLFGFGSCMRDDLDAEAEPIGKGESRVSFAVTFQALSNLSPRKNPQPQWRRDRRNRRYLHRMVQRRRLARGKRLPDTGADEDFGPRPGRKPDRTDHAAGRIHVQHSLRTLPDLRRGQHGRSRGKHPICRKNRSGGGFQADRPGMGDRPRTDAGQRSDVRLLHGQQTGVRGGPGQSAAADDQFGQADDPRMAAPAGIEGHDIVRHEESL